MGRLNYSLSIRYIPTFIRGSATWECETCQACGRAFRIMLSVKDEIWNRVTNTYDGGGGCYCIDCIDRVEKQGIIISSDDLDLAPFYPKLAK